MPSSDACPSASPDRVAVLAATLFDCEGVTIGASCSLVPGQQDGLRARPAGRAPFPTSVRSCASSAAHGKLSQNGMLATDRAYLLSAEVPGVKVELSPAVLKAAACCSAVWMAFVLVPA